MEVSDHEDLLVLEIDATDYWIEDGVNNLRLAKHCLRLNCKNVPIDWQFDWNCQSVVVHFALQFDSTVSAVCSKKNPMRHLCLLQH